MSKPPAKSKLTVGSRLLYDGGVWVVTAFAGTNVVLRSAANNNELMRVALVDLVTSEGFRNDDPTDTEPVVTQPTFPESVDAAEQKRVLELIAHLNEATTGYRSGTSMDALENEPKDEYDVTVHSTDKRMHAKAKELGIGVRTLYLQRQNFREHGINGLLDQRTLREIGSRVDERVKLALKTVINSREKKSNITKQGLRILTERELKKTHPTAVIALPADTTFNRLVDEIGKGKGLGGSAKERRNIANRPERPYSHFFATRPGELVLLDSTPLDVFAMDPVNFKWVRIELTIAVDLATRSLLAWRFTPLSTKRVDAALLLYDILCPKFLRKTSSDAGRWAYVGVPEKVLIEVSGDEDRPQLSCVPFLHPESVLVDRGKVFISNAFQQACSHLGVNMMIARPLTPTDKVHVERMFRTIRESFLELLPAYKGPDVYSRGENVEEDAFLFIDELEDLFAEWVATYWQQRDHEGMRWAELPHLKLSPNDAFQEGIARAGFVYVVPSPGDLFALLPTEWRTIQHYGVEIFGLRYDGSALVNYANQKSPFGGTEAGKWPIRYDPRDHSQVYFQDPETFEWHCIPWTGAQGLPRPFNDKILSYAKSLLVLRGETQAKGVDLAAIINGILDRMETGDLEESRLRKLAAIRTMNADAAKRDRNRTAPAAPDEEAPLPNFDEPIDEPATETDASAPAKEIVPFPVVSDEGDDDLF